MCVISQGHISYRCREKRTTKRNTYFIRQEDCGWDVLDSPKRVKCETPWYFPAFELLGCIRRSEPTTSWLRDEKENVFNDLRNYEILLTEDRRAEELDYSCAAYDITNSQDDIRLLFSLTISKTVLLRIVSENWRPWTCIR